MLCLEFVECFYSQGSGMRPQNPSPSAPPIVQSNPEYPHAPVQMPQPFGSGIGFKPHVTNTFNTPPMGYQVPPMAHPQSPPYPNYAPTSHYLPQNPHPVSHQNYQSPPQNVSYGQAYPTYAQTPPNIYPNLIQPAPFSYTQPHPNPNIRRSTSGYMRQVKFWEIPEIVELNFAGI